MNEGLTVNSINESKTHVRKLVLFCLLICLGVFFRDMYGIPINKYIFLMISVFAFLLLNEGAIVAFIAFIIPFLPGLPANYIIGLAIPFLLFKQKHVRLNIYMFAAYAFLLLEMLHLFLPLSSLGDFFKFSSYIILLTLILLKKNNDYNYTVILLSYCFGVISAFTSILIHSLQYMPLYLVFEKGIRIGNIASVNQQFDPTIITLTMDQNTLGYFCAIGIAVLLILQYAKRLKLTIGIPLTIITFIYGSLTLSRTFILISFLVFFYYFIINLRMNSTSIKAVFSLLFAVILMIVTIQTYFPSTLELIITRFQESDLTNGRGQIFEQYNHFIFSSLNNFLFGIGIQNMNIKANLFNVPHNGLQQIFVAGGVVGLFLLSLWLIGMYCLHAPNSKRQLPVFLLPLITMFAYIQGLQFLYPYFIMLPLIVVFSALRLSD